MMKLSAEQCVGRISAALREGGRAQPSVTDIADAIFLARYLPGRRFVVPAPGSGISGGETGGDPRHHATTTSMHRPDRRAGSRGASGPTRHVTPVRVPGSRGFGVWSRLQQSLSPLRLLTPGPGASELDEVATAERTEQALGVWSPVMHGPKRRWRDVTLVLDPGPGYPAWLNAHYRVQLMLERLGAFREVHTYVVDLAGPRPTVQRARIHDGRPAVRENTIRLPAAGLADPGGRRVLLLVSDGTGPGWEVGGSAHALLAHWASFSPTAIISIVPLQHWRTRGARVTTPPMRSPHPMKPNKAWRVAGDAPHPPIPLLEPQPYWLGNWSRTVAAEANWTPVPLLVRGTSRRSPPAGESPRERVQRFRATAAPPSFDLLRLTAIEESPTVLAMEVIRRLFVPDARVSHLAEILCSGLVEPTEHGYVFGDGIRAELLRFVDTDQHWNVIRHRLEWQVDGPSEDEHLVVPSRYGERVAVEPPSISVPWPAPVRRAPGLLTLLGLWETARTELILSEDRADDDESRLTGAETGGAEATRTDPPQLTSRPAGGPLPVVACMTEQPVRGRLFASMVAREAVAAGLLPEEDVIRLPVARLSAEHLAVRATLLLIVPRHPPPRANDALRLLGGMRGAAGEGGPVVVLCGPRASVSTLLKNHTELGARLDRIELAHHGAADMLQLLEGKLRPYLRVDDAVERRLATVVTKVWRREPVPNVAFERALVIADLILSRAHRRARRLTIDDLPSEGEMVRAALTVRGRSR